MQEAPSRNQSVREEGLKPNPNWRDAKEGEIVGAFMRRTDDGKVETGQYQIKNGEAVEVNVR